MLQDIRFALRYWRKHPAFAATAIGLLALSIAACAVIFSAADALLLKPLPVKEPGRLVRIIEVRPPLPPQTWFLPAFWDLLRVKSTQFERVFGGFEVDSTLTQVTASEPQPLRAMIVTPNYFDALGVSAAMGRVLDAKDEWSGELPVVLSERFWVNRFASDPAILGKAITLGGQPFKVAGVMPRGFHGVTVETSPEVWVARAGGQYVVPARMRDPSGCCVFELSARLKPEATLASASGEVRSLWTFFVESTAKADDRAYQLSQNLQVESIANGVSVLRARFGIALRLLLTAVVLLLLMACANVAGLLLSSAAARSRETVVRMAVGASGLRLARQWITEALLLALTAGGLGIALTYALLPQVAHVLPPLRDRDTSRLALAVDLVVDQRLLYFTLLAVVATAILLSLSPVWQVLNRDLQSVLRASSSAGRLRARPALVCLQIALCTLLLVSAGVFVRSVDRLSHTRTGLDQEHIVGFTVKSGLRKYTAEQAAALARSLEDGARALPGVSNAAIASRGLMRGSGIKATVGAEGARTTEADFLNTSMNSVTLTYFDTMGIPLVSGRLFRQAEAKDARVVTRAFANRFFPGQDPIGKRFGIGHRTIIRGEFEVIGVVEDVKYRGLREPIHPQLFSCFCEREPALFEDFHLEVRAKGDPRSVIQSVTRLMQTLDPQLPFAEVHTLSEEVESTIWQERIVARLSTVFACAAAMLAGLGLYGMLAFFLAQHLHEVGIRKALGASSQSLLGWLSARVVPVTVVGVAVGLGASLFAGRWIQELLWETSPRDVVAYSAASAWIAAIVLAAAWMPARKALRVDPASVLRQD